ncbi:response regulator [Paenibacillus sp.]|uniref:response regulator n=1 Tax=Paenibacillus sp. TaxID=58172 RepID=UPI002D287B72|nr:response regulator [Paenibacillus sp.]HZG83559.1 response regulator [Paenibacillus sp.]
MPNIVIVDDESIFRRGLRSMIASLDPEWNVVGDARDGYEALDLLQQLRPDVMLTDIRMPRMDGIQLQKIARERFPELISVVVSGYEDFTYVKESMRHGAKDYVMKPIEREELGKLLERLKEEVRKNAARHVPPPETKEDQRKARTRASERLAAALMRGVVGADDIARLEEVGVRLAAPRFACMVIKLDKQSVGTERYRKADPSLFQLYIQQFVQEVLDRRSSGFSFVLSDSEVVAILNAEGGDESMRRLLDLAESIRLQIKSLSNLTVTIGVSRLSPGPESLPKSYREAEIALLHRLLVGGDKVLAYEQTMDGRPEAAETREWSWEALERAISAGRSGEAEQRASEAVAELCREAPTPQTVHRHICKLLIQYYELAVEWGVTKAWLGEKDIRELLFDVCSTSASDELAELCRALFGRLAACVAAGSPERTQDPIAKAIRYMETHYERPITLKTMSDILFLNPAYFSTLFKQRTGVTFVDKLTDIRIEAAKKRLATTSEMVAEVAERTGFRNVRHFNRVFKSETGLSPSEYRERVRGGG